MWKITKYIIFPIYKPLIMGEKLFKPHYKIHLRTEYINFKYKLLQTNKKTFLIQINHYYNNTNLNKEVDKNENI
ncbi:hypothetical protein C6356_03005 [Bacillus wiedmannii]|uniref:Uncharacterized protein n=1 Tax=Bacillus wiedmannii TaxID=1890302 RepID=A0ABX5E096_9BACI|nr:hypothetical protein C6356_03005 [Bacillus wiedmannii]PRT43418.1 hypothetical protein C6357_05660 [Bacillus wiedmannii]